MEIPKTIRCLSLWQPWAQAMATLRPGTGIPVKYVETRHWKPDIPCGFWLAIHAAKKKFKATDYDPEFVKAVREFRLDANPMTYGAVLCIVWMKGYAPVESIRETIDPIELLFGNYVNEDDCRNFQQRYGWVTEPAQLHILKTPFPLKGHQGIFSWTVPEGLEFK